MKKEISTEAKKMTQKERMREFNKIAKETQEKLPRIETTKTIALQKIYDGL